jgi:hypothetical protein
MAISPPTRAQRDANLDALQAAVNQWATAEQSRLENETKFLRSILQGRGITAAGSANLAKVSSLVVSEINQFLLSK